MFALFVVIINYFLLQTGEVDASIQNEPAEDHHNNQNEQLDEMIIQLWSIVNEKNDILRRQTELEYLRRGHRLEVKTLRQLTPMCQNKNLVYHRIHDVSLILS